MINISGDTNAYHVNQVNRLKRLERVVLPEIKDILNGIWFEVADLLDQGIYEVEPIVRSYSSRTISWYRKTYTRIGSIYYTEISDMIKQIETRDEESVFWAAYGQWLYAQSLIKVKSVLDLATIHAIRGIIDRMVREEKSYNEIAREVRKAAPILNVSRAKRIVVTEVHTAFMKSIDETIKASKLPVEIKMWSATLDKRVRTPHAQANGQRVRMNEKFVVDGENLDFPGDPNGSARNIIYCRCVALYYTSQFLARNALRHFQNLNIGV